MTVVRCPQGHESASDDYCDTCGTPLAHSPAIEQPACPACGWDPDPSARFCEACGRDLGTGAMPRPAHIPAPRRSGSAPTDTRVGWVAEVWVDPEWHATRDGDHPCPSAGRRAVVTLTARSVLVGRPSASRGIRPDVDCADDPGVSRRQAQLSTDGNRWWVEDLRSANGTYVGPVGGRLPTDPVPPGERRELGDGDQVYVGSWTRLALRPAAAADPSD